MKLKFTTREKLVVCFLVHGDTDQQISRVTGMHINAVRSVTKAVIRKLCLRNRTEVAVWGWRNGLITRERPMTNLEVELKKLRKAAGEAVRRGIEYSDWESECAPRLAARDGDPPDRLDQVFAANICRKIWTEACAAEGLIAFDGEGLNGAGC